MGNEFEWWDLSVEIWKLSTLVWLSVIEVKFKIRTSQSSTHTNSPKVSWILTPTQFQLEPTWFTYLDRSNQNLGWSRLQIQFSSFASSFFKPFDPRFCNLQIKYKNNSRARFSRLLGPFGNVVLVTLFKFFGNTYGWKSVVQICVVQICVMLFKQRKLFCTQVLGIFQLS